jgi:hypothetical protein
VKQTERARVPADQRLALQTNASGNRVAIMPVAAKDIVGWEGVDTHKLFELNVRGELRRNPVSRQLDAAIRREHDHSDFLASHNGMTVTCDRFDDSDTKHVVVHRPSIVNGAQSTMAFLRADGDGLLTDELRVFVKLVEVEGRPTFANSVSARSNTQNAVNPRNLVANTGPQRRLLKEFAEGFPGIYYETKPDAHKTVELKRHNARVIGNDDAAQLLCTVYVQEPWLAVKRNSLFEADQYPRIFGEAVHAEHVVLVDELAMIVNEAKERVPERYRKSWKLTKIVLLYLLSQVLRADEELKAILADPADALADRDRLREQIKRPLGAALLTLKKRKDKHDRENQEDDFRVAFKNTDELRALRDQAREEYLTLIEAANLSL